MPLCPLSLLHHPKLCTSFAISFITPLTLEIQLQQAVSTCVKYTTLLHLSCLHWERVFVSSVDSDIWRNQGPEAAGNTF